MNTTIIDLMNAGDWANAISKTLDIFAPIVNGNNMFHFACIRGNTEVIEQMLKLESIKIYDSNDDGDTGCHLLAKNEWSNILCSTVAKYPKFLKLRNYNNKLVISYTLDNPQLFNKIYEIMDENDYCKYLNTIDTDDRTVVLDLIDKFQFNNMPYLNTIQKMCSCNIDMNIPHNSPPLLYAIMHKMNNVAKIMITNCETDVNITNSKFVSPLMVACQQNSIQICSELLKKGANVNYGGAENDYVPINIAVMNGFWKLCELLMTNDKFNYNQKDKRLNIPIFYAIDSYMRSKMPEKIMSQFVTHSDLMSPNIENTTPLHMLSKHNLLVKFQEILTSKKIDINQANRFNQTSLSLSPMTDENLCEYVESLRLKGNTQKLKVDIKLNKPPTSTSNFGIFNPDIIHNAIYTIYLLNSYDTLSMPFQIEDEDKKVWSMWQLENQLAIPQNPMGLLFMRVVSIYTANLYCMLPFIIFWHNKDLHYVYDQTKIYLRRSINTTKRFVLLKLTIFPHTSITHANVILYDTELNNARRFEPYGDWEYNDAYVMDTYIKKLFIKCLPKDKRETFTYLRPKDYLFNTQFQLVSSDHNDINKKLGDPAGYCLAWCFWFVELKLKNPDILDVELVSQGLQDIIDEADKKDRNPLMTYIRNYAVHLDNQKNQILTAMNIPVNEHYELTYSEEKINKISKYIANYCVQLLN